MNTDAPALDERAYEAPAEAPQKPVPAIVQAEVALRALRRRQAPVRRAFKGIHSMPAIARMNGALPPHKYARRLRELALTVDAAERAEVGS